MSLYVNKLYVWIASHIHHESRLKSLKTAIESVLANTVKPIICLSLSAEKDVDKIEQELKALLKNEKSYVYAQKTRKRQFEHIKIIYDEVMKNKEADWVSFLDDDDLVSPARFETILSYINGKKKGNPFAESDDKNPIIPLDLIDKLLNVEVPKKTDEIYYQTTYYEIPPFGYVEIKNWEDGVKYVSKNSVLKPVCMDEHGTRVVNLREITGFFETESIKKKYADDMISSVFDTVFTSYMKKFEVRVINETTYLHLFSFKTPTIDNFLLVAFFVLFWAYKLRVSCTHLLIYFHTVIWGFLL